MKEKEIDVKKVLEHYEIYLNGVFYCSCDVGELNSVFNEIDNKIF